MRGWNVASFGVEVFGNFIRLYFWWWVFVFSTYVFGVGAAPFGPQPKWINILQRWEAEMLKVLTLRLSGRFLVGFWVKRLYVFKILIGHRHPLWSGMNIMSSELRKDLRDGSTNRGNCWVSRIRHHLQHPKHPKEANIQMATNIKHSNCGIC